MMRREVLMFPPLVATGLLAAPQATFAALSSPDITPIAQLFQQWLRLWNLSHAPELSDHEHSDVVDAFTEIEHEIRASPCHTAEDCIAQVIVASSFGDFGLNSRRDEPEFWAFALSQIRGGTQ